MSHTVIKSIRIIDNQVFWQADSNNVSPRDYRLRLCPSLTEVLQSQGIEALDLEILAEYENGNFQGVKNRYTSAESRLRSMPEYKAYDWCNHGHAYGTPEYKAFHESRHSDAFKDLMRLALKPRRV